MKKELSTRDWEAISAYLDDQLPAREKMRLEKRIQEDARLQAAVKEMEQTRALVRSLPQVRAPRNFTLTPEMAGVKSTPARLFPTFQWASAFAALLFILVLAGDLVGASFTARVASSPLEMESVESLQFEATQPAVLEEQTPAEAPAAGAPAPSPPEQEGMADIQGESELPPGAAEEQAPIQKSIAPQGTAVQAAPEMLTPAPTATYFEPETARRPVGGFSLIRVVEILLAAFALATGLIALLLRRAR